MKTVAILTGGTSNEREVSLWSAGNVSELLKDTHKIKTFDLPRDLDLFLSERDSIDVVLPILHGGTGEDGTIQGMLKSLGMKFVFSDVGAHATGIDKAKTKILVSHAGVRTPESLILTKGDAYTFSRPVVIKPLTGGSTIGISLVREKEKLEEALLRAFQEEDRVLVEDLIEGREFTASVIEENGDIIPLPVIEIRAKGLFDYAQKYTTETMAEEICPAPISEELTERIQLAARIAHETIGARHISRSDFLVDQDGNEWFLEVNTIPGMTKNSLVPKALLTSGRSLKEALMHWIEGV